MEDRGVRERAHMSWERHEGLRVGGPKNVILLKVLEGNVTDCTGVKYVDNGTKI